VSALVQRAWRAQIEREGTGSAGLFGVEATDGEEPPCPCCGTAAPLVGGACSECGLQLE
jgi:predicted amidophosphoribosyltransferase